MVAYACSPSNLRSRSKGSGIEGYPLLHKQLKASLGCAITFSEINKETRNKSMGNSHVAVRGRAVVLPVHREPAFDQ